MAVEEACGTSEPSEEAEAVVAEAMAVEEAPLVSLPESAVIAAAVSEGGGSEPESSSGRDQCPGVCRGGGGGERGDSRAC